MKVVILCGGLGTRLREETEHRPKPMVEIGGRPILWHIMKIFATHGLNQFVCCLGYKGSTIKEYFLNYEAMNNDFTVCLGHQNDITYHNGHGERDLSVTLADTGLETQTGGRLRRIKKFIDKEPFMLTYGDGLADIDIKALLEFHNSHGKIATVTTVRPISRFGVIDLKPDGVVRSFAEKPQSDGWISAGFFVFSKKIFDYLSNDSTMLEHEPLARLAAEKQLMAYRHPGFFYAMDTYREYSYLNNLWDSGKAPWKTWG